MVTSWASLRSGYGCPRNKERPEPSVRFPPIADISRWCDRCGMGSYLVVFIGGGFGAALRHGANRVALAYLGPAFPYGTLFVNVVGGLLMGMLAEVFLVKTGLSEEFKLFLTTGLLGGFTTFSAFSLEASLMWQRGDHITLAAYAVGSVVLAVAAVFLGMAMVRPIA